MKNLYEAIKWQDLLESDWSPKRLHEIVGYLTSTEEEEEYFALVLDFAYQLARDSHDNYWDYLESQKWQDIKQAVIRRDKKCQHCGCDNENFFQVHHRWYIPRSQENPKNISHLILLCGYCHESEHGRSWRSW